MGGEGDRKRAMQGQPGRNGCLLNIQPRSLFQVRGSDTQLASRLSTSKINLLILLFHVRMNKTCQSSVLRRGVPRVLSLISCFSWRCHSLTSLADPVLLFIPKKHQPTRITSCLPVHFSSESCRTIHLNVCGITMATNIHPQCQCGDVQIGDSWSPAPSFSYLQRPAGQRQRLLHPLSKYRPHH